MAALLIEYVNRLSLRHILSISELIVPIFMRTPFYRQSALCRTSKPEQASVDNKGTTMRHAFLAPISALALSWIFPNSEGG
jgi:hypothetical protein